MTKRVRQTIAILLIGASLCGCTTVAQRTEAIRARETVLFEGLARVGRILNSGDQIAWNSAGVLPILATTSSLHVGDESWPYTWVKSASVGSFHAASQMFVKTTTYEDLLILRSTSDWLNGGDVLVFMPEGRTWRDSLGGPAQRAIAQQAAGIIEAQRTAVDPFGQTDPPRPVWLASPERGLVYATWAKTPLYLDLHFAEQRQALDALFKSVRDEATESFYATMSPLLSAAPAGEGAYSFVDVGELDIDWLHHRKIGKRLREHLGEHVAGHHPSLRSLVVLDPIRIWLEEKLDPAGHPSVKARFSCTVRYYDIDRSRLASHAGFSSTVTLPLQTWLDAGEDGMLAEVRNAMRDIARQIDGSLNRVDSR